MSATEKRPVIEVSGLKKQYKLGQIGGGTLTHDLQSWWARVRGKEDPNTVIGTDQRLFGQTFMALNGVDLTVCNGALLYDFSTESVLHRSTLNREQATTAIIDILAKFPRMGVEVMAGNGEMYVIHANEVTHAHQVDEHLGSIACPVESVPDGWVKVVFASDPESIRKLGQYAKTKYYGRDNYFLATNSIYLEIMPGGVSKASGLHDLCALMSKSMKNTVVIGDYYNDLEIMREAGYAVAVANAPAEVKAAADHVTTCTCAEGAVGEYLYSLIGKTDE